MDNEAVQKLFDEAFAVLTALRAQVVGDSLISAAEEPKGIPLFPCSECGKKTAGGMGEGKDRVAICESCYRAGPPAENYPTTRDALEEWAFGRGLEKPTWKTLAMSCGFKAGTKHLSPDELYIFAKAIDNHLKKVGK